MDSDADKTEMPALQGPELEAVELKLIEAAQKVRQSHDMAVESVPSLQQPLDLSLRRQTGSDALTLALRSVTHDEKCCRWRSTSCRWAFKGQSACQGLPA